MMSNQEFRSRVRRLQDLIDAELQRRGVDPANPQETSSSRYIDRDVYLDGDENIIDAEYWEIEESPGTRWGLSHLFALETPTRSWLRAAVTLLVVGFLLGAIV